MKKLLAIVALIFLGTQVYASETEVQESARKDNRTNVHPENFSHWSISLSGGANALMSDYTSYEMPKFGEYLRLNTSWAISFQGEYMINPIWGVSLQYMYSSQNKTARNTYNEKFHPVPDISTDRDLQMHESNVQVKFNILNAVRRTRTHTEWNVFVGLGAGVLTFERSMDGEKSFRPAWVIPLSLNVEYSPIPSLGIFFDSQFRWYGDDRVNGVEAGQMKDMSLYGGLGLKYHIGATKKPHVYNVDMNTYEPLRVQSIKSEEERDNEDLRGKIDFLTDQINAMNNSIASLEQTRKQVLENTDSINNLRDQLGSIDAGRVVFENNLYEFNSEDNAIYFDPNSATIKTMYYADIVKIARRMQNDYKLKLKLIGYCDSEGTPEFNKELAQKRINAVIYLLVNRFRISKERFITDNAGMITGENEVDELNRRVDIEYVY